jgi:hypothetical protein
MGFKPVAVSNYNIEPTKNKFKFFMLYLTDPLWCPAHYFLTIGNWHMNGYVSTTNKHICHL